ncbi:MAG: hypothetical protein IT374_05595 [Polyangiaceae bacterium]|nr:hypothetical protein [Polyangiaceae bacterium]
MRRSLILVSGSVLWLACSGEGFSEAPASAGATGATTGQSGASQAGSSGKASGGTSSGGTSSGGASSGGTSSGGTSSGGAAGSTGGSDPGGAGGSGAGAGGGSVAGAGGSDGVAGAGGGNVAGAGGGNVAGAGGGSVAGAGGGSVAGASGAGGAQPTCANDPTACKGGHYCNVDSGTCAPCGDMNRFVVGAPQYLAMMPGAAERSFPRVQVFGDGARMFFRTKLPSGVNGYQISSASAPFVGGAEEDCCVNKGVDDSGPLPMPNSVGATALSFVQPIDTAPGARFVFLDSARPYSGPAGTLPEGRRIYLASRAGSQYYYAPVMLLDTGRFDYSVAFAYEAGPPRFFWMSERYSGAGSSDPPRLFTITTTDQPGALKRVEVPLEGCATGAHEEDLAPWVLPNGNQIFFHARCAADERLHVYRAPLKDGVFAGPATRVTMIGFDKEDYRTPSLSPDRCTMYLEADNGIYALTRQ